MKTRFFIILLLFVMTVTSSGRLSGQSIKGIVLSCDSVTLAGANISLLGMDSTLIKGTTADAEGRFALDVEKNSSFNVLISFTGFSTEIIQVRGIKGTLDFERVFLKEDSQLLDEVTVRASNVTNRVDKSIIIPTTELLKRSDTSLSLLRNMNLHGLRIDEIEQTVSINGGQPIYMIDGIEKTKQEFLSVNPKNIARIEYEDAPSIRNIDKGASGTINLVLKKKDIGGSFYGNVLGSPMTGFLNADLYFAHNWTKSELSVNYFNNWRDYTHRCTDISESFIGDGKKIERNFKGVDSSFGYLNQGVYLTYTYQHNPNTMFSATLRNDFGKQHTSVDGFMDDSQSGERYFRESKMNYDSYIPALDLFFRHNFKNRQWLEVNVVGTYLTSDYERNLQDERTQVMRLSNTTDNSRKSLISEVVYHKNFKTTQLILGYKNSLSSSKNNYREVAGGNEKLTTSNHYVYGSLVGKLKKLSYSIGSGMKIYSVENGIDEKTYVKNHSTLSLMYNICNDLNVKLSSYFTPTLPAISQLSGVTQSYDEILRISGNPDLKASHSVGGKFLFNYSRSGFSSDLSLGYKHRAKTIYFDIQPLRNGAFLSRPINGISDNSLSAELGCSYTRLFNHVNLFSTIGYSSFASKGKDFRHHLDDFYWYFAAQVYWGKWTLTGYYTKPQKSLLAETIMTDENNSQISLVYKLGNLNLFAAVKYPFEKNGWKCSDENLSKANPGCTKIYIKDNSNMIVLGVTYSLNFGKGIKQLKRNLNNSDNETSILKVQE